jgi:hypothetical protein
MVSAAVACLPTAGSLLLLEALFMQISGVSLTLTWPHRLWLLRVLGKMPLLQAFPFPSTLGEVTLHQISHACMFIYISHGNWVFPPFLWSFSPTAAFTSFPAPDCWACTTTPALSGWLVRDSPPPLFSTQGTPPSLLCVFFVIIAYYSVSLFSLGGGRSVQGTMLIWPRVVCPQKREAIVFKGRDIE